MQDVQYGDIDIMDGRRDFTISPDRFGGLPEYVKELKAKGIRFMTILVTTVQHCIFSHHRIHANSYTRVAIGSSNCCRARVPPI